MYPTHAWTDDMKPIVPAKESLASAPVIIGVAADSGCGKSTFLRRILGALGTEVTPGHTAVGDMMTVVCLDDYHTNDRAGRKATGFTALDAKENDFASTTTTLASRIHQSSSSPTRSWFSRACTPSMMRKLVSSWTL